MGKINHQAADDTGLPESKLVAQGAPDTQCGLLGMGVKDRGQVGIVLGLSAPVQAGAYSSLEEAMKAMKPKMRELELDRLAALEYTEHYQTWAGVAQSLEKLSEDMK